MPGNCLGQAAMPDSSKQIAETVRRETRIADDAAHRNRVHGVVSGNRYDASSIGHNDMLSLPGDPEFSFFERPDGAHVRDSGYLRHPLRRDFHLTQVLFASESLSDVDVFPNRVLDVRESFFFGGTLRPASREARARDAISLFSQLQSYWVLHTSQFSASVSDGAARISPFSSKPRRRRTSALIAPQRPAGVRTAWQTIVLCCLRTGDCAVLKPLNYQCRRVPVFPCSRERMQHDATCCNQLQRFRHATFPRRDFQADDNRER